MIPAILGAALFAAVFVAVHRLMERVCGSGEGIE